MRPPAHVWEFEAIGAPWRIETSVPVDTEARQRVEGLVEGFDRDWSRFRDDSTVAALARFAGAVSAPSDAVAMLDTLAAVAAATADAVTPLAGGSLSALGYDASLGLRHGEPTPAPPWRDALRWSDEQLTLAVPAMIDVGCLGKGRLVDRVLAALADLEGRVVVDASGDVRVRGGTERVGLEHPFDRRRVVGVWEVADAALCASATNRRAWGNGLHHVIDGRTGRPVRAITATWAVAPDAMHADAVATALFFDGGPELAHGWGVSWVRMTTDGRLEWSPGCAAQLFTR